MTCGKLIMSMRKWTLGKSSLLTSKWTTLYESSLIMGKWRILGESYLFGFEVNKPFKILIKTSNATECIEYDIQNIGAPRTDDHII